VPSDRSGGLAFSDEAALRYTPAMRDREAGFTLIEMMVAVAVISILAAIALPNYFRETRRAKAMAEVQPTFNDLRVRLEQYLQENGAYPVTSGELPLHPAGAPSTSPLDITQLPQAWKDLKVRISGQDQVRCGYTWATGLTSADPVGPVAGGSATATPPVGFGFTAPSFSWYYLLAKCNMDGAGNGDDMSFSWYFASSLDATIQKLNEGR
jgi:prepilin-type N-terminal cleavage/methylation domain-containing protein